MFLLSIHARERDPPDDDMGDDTGKNWVRLVVCPPQRHHDSARGGMPMRWQHPPPHADALIHAPAYK